MSPRPHDLAQGRRNDWPIPWPLYGRADFVRLCLARHAILVLLARVFEQRRSTGGAVRIRTASVFACAATATDCARMPCHLPVLLRSTSAPCAAPAPV